MESKSINLLAVLAIFVIGFLTYLNSFNNLFVYDDYLLIIQNEGIKSFKNIFHIFKHDLYYDVSMSSYYRPFVSLSLMIDYFLYNLKIPPIGYHFTNTLFHVGNAILLFFLLKIIFSDYRIAFIASSLFVCHPVHTQAVTYISGRADLIAFFFALICFILAIRKKQNPVTYILCGLSFVISILSKETYLITPFLICLYFFVFRDGRVFLKKYFFLFFIVILGYTFFRINILKIIQKDPFPVVFGYRLLNLPSILAEYIYILIFPIGLHIERDIELAKIFTDPRIIKSLLLLILIFILTVRFYKRKKILFFASLWFFLGLIPVVNIIVPINALIAEHWLYLPSVGFFVIEAILILKIFTFSKLLKILSVLLFFTLIFGYSELTRLQNMVWHDEIILYKYTILQTPEKMAARLHYNLGCAYMDAKIYNLAIREYETSIRLKSKALFLAYFNLAHAYYNINQKEKAIQIWKAALNIPAANMHEEKQKDTIREILKKEGELDGF